MRYEWLNNGAAFPAGHRRAGQFGVAVDFEDGRPEPQNIYFPTKDAEAVADKLLKLYGSTQVRNAELRGPASYGRETPAEPATPSSPATPPAPASNGRMTAEQRLEAVADLGDPAKAPAAIIRLVKEGGGGDLTQDEQAKIRNAETVRMQNEVAAFMEANPEYYASPKNAALLRDRVFANANGSVITAQHFQQSFDELSELGVLESASESGNNPPATQQDEPPAPPPIRPRGSTGVRPSALSAGSRPAPSGPGLTFAEVMAIAGTDEYVERLRSEPGFRAKVEAVLAKGA